MTGQDAKFTIVLGNDHGTEPPIPGPWNLEAGRFVYVWIANKDQMLAAEVENNRDGTLTATYASDFPGTYNMYIEDVRFVKGGSQFSKVQPIRGSPFTLTISGNRTIDINALPICDSEQDAPPSSFSSFWRTGTWISSTLAKHGVGRTGWVFQPKHCSYNTFSFEDLMMLAALEEPTWLLFVGTSVQRGVFLAIVDMLLSKGQKDNFPSSALQKCWGWSDFRIGSLRVSYQVLFERAHPSYSVSWGLSVLPTTKAWGWATQRASSLGVAKPTFVRLPTARDRFLTEDTISSRTPSSKQKEADFNVRGELVGLCEAHVFCYAR